jgi:hypothetical protein
MQQFYTLVFLLVAVTTGYGQTFQVDTLLKNGPINKTLNIVFLGDGYTASEQNKFIADVQAVLPTLFGVSPFKEYKSYFNVFAVRVISAQSGANHPKTSPDSDCGPVPAATVNNYFGSTFDYGNIHRLLYPTKASQVAVVLSQHMPRYAQAFILINTPHYGGAGGTFAASSTHAAGPQIAIHEIGHSFANLADEYWAGVQYAMERPNLTQESSGSLVKWKNWVGTNDIDVYPHAEDPSWYRPHQNCRMRYLNDPFCNVCIETFIEKIHALTNPIAQYAPTQSVLPMPENTLEFELSLMKPEPNTLKVVWEQNEVVVAGNEASFSLPVSAITSENVVIRATITDTTTLTRSTSHQVSHVYTVEWIVNPTITGIEITAVENHYKLSVYPNPVKDVLTVSYTLFKPTEIKIIVTDFTGREIDTVIQRQPAGEHTHAVDMDKVKAGAYYVTIRFGKTEISKKILRQ